MVMLLMKTSTNGEVVELVYGTSLENWRRFVAYRGFESHPLRQYSQIEISGLYIIWRCTQVVEGGSLLNCQGSFRAAEVQILSSPPNKDTMRCIVSLFYLSATFSISIPFLGFLRFRLSLATVVNSLILFNWFVSLAPGS